MSAEVVEGERRKSMALIFPWMTVEFGGDSPKLEA